jgi:anti-sigma B factor antagonist
MPMADDTIIHSSQPIAGGLIARPEGEIGFARSPQLRSELMQLIQQHKPAKLVLDMSAIPYMDSSGVATLVEAMQQQRQAGGKLVLCCMQERVRSVFEISRLDMVFTIVADAEAAASV